MTCLLLYEGFRAKQQVKRNEKSAQYFQLNVALGTIFARKITPGFNLFNRSPAVLV